MAGSLSRLPTVGRDLYSLDMSLLFCNFVYQIKKVVLFIWKQLFIMVYIRQSPVIGGLIHGHFSHKNYDGLFIRHGAAHP